MRKSLEQRREDPARAFVPELELPIESLVRRRHQKLGRRQGARVHVAEEQPEMQLSLANVTSGVYAAPGRLASNTTPPPFGRAGTARPPCRAASVSAASAGRTPARAFANAIVPDRPHVEPPQLEDQEHLGGPPSDTTDDRQAGDELLVGASSAWHRADGMGSPHQEGPVTAGASGSPGMPRAHQGSHRGISHAEHASHNGSDRRGGDSSGSARARGARRAAAGASSGAADGSRSTGRGEATLGSWSGG